MQDIHIHKNPHTIYYMFSPLTAQKYYYYYLGVIQMDSHEYKILSEVLNNEQALRFIKVKRLKAMLHTYKLFS